MIDMLKHVVDNVNHTHEHRRDCNKEMETTKRKNTMEIPEVKIASEMKNSLNGLNSRLDIADGRYRKLGNRSKETTKGNTKGKNNGKKCNRTCKS